MLPGVLPPELGATVMGHRQRSLINILSAPQPPQPPQSVFSLGNGLSSVEAWFSTALDIEEVLSGTGGDQLHVMVADVIKSFDTVDRSILDCGIA